MSEPDRDYYFILGISESAAVEGIRRAYRRRAQECHPDHGGSHEAMLEINEAYEVLSDPASRLVYDEYLKTEQSSNADLGEKIRAARQKSEQYPRNWGEFEKWLDRLEQDFAKAAGAGTSTYYMPFPKTGESNTAFLFILGGGIAGLFLGTLPLFSAFKDADGWHRFALILPICLGAWLGKGIHSMAGEALASRKKGGPTVAAPTTSRSKEVPITQEEGIVRCPKCSQKLRLPNVEGKIRLKCPACKESFERS